jgi:hypothetical protein
VLKLTILDMFMCYICNSVLHGMLAYRAHLQRHSGLGEITLPIRCCQDGCKSTFLTIFNLMRHIRSYHDNHGSKTSSYADEMTAVNKELLDGSLTCESGEAKFEEVPHTDVMPIEALREEAISVVAMLRAKGNVPYSVIPEIISSFNEMSGNLLRQVEQESVNCLSESGVDPLVVGKVVQKIQQYRQPLSFLETAYKPDKFFENHPLSVRPEAVTLGSRIETVRGVSSIVYDMFQYVSVEATICSLLKNENYVRAVTCVDEYPGYITSYRDGVRFKKHALFSNPDKTSLSTQLF